jgi:hypothetical protein
VDSHQAGSRLAPSRHEERTEQGPAGSRGPRVETGWSLWAVPVHRLSNRRDDDTILADSPARRLHGIGPATHTHMD